MSGVWYCTFHGAIAGQEGAIHVPEFCPRAVAQGELRYAHECRGHIVLADIKIREAQ